MLKKFWHLLGPVILALSLVVITLLSFPSHLKLSFKQERENAVSLTDNSFKNGEIKTQAFTDQKKNFVPFFGSSEWSRMDSMHPSVLAKKYHRNYIPYLVGKRGTQSLSHYFGLQHMTPYMENKKAVFVISPQWFSSQGTDGQAVQKYLSNTQVIDFILQANPKDEEAHIAAQRLLILNPSVVYSGYLKKISKGEPISQVKLSYLKSSAYLSKKVEVLFSHLSYSKSYQDKIYPRTKGLPKHFSYETLNKLADRRGQIATSNNPFKISNTFFTGRIAKNMKRLKGFQSKESYIISPEYTDFQLVLSQFAKKNIDVMFVVTPVNKEWAAYTGLDLQKYQDAVQKIKFQLQAQGFNNITDLSQDGGKPYFMNDTIHLGWNGWLAFDKQVQPFLATQTTKVKYDIDSYFYTKEWANLTYKEMKTKTVK
ncbi:D-alanyl-lipoteichoic acid biosynthesis protein DltD [Streptococcus parauberis]|uniref:Protein DltD n=1 Tax=Streptococcus parauberis NCFD 2020 TaxID=873447 RepID=F1Z1I2_9STRE|nr:D-alanyl-lipoteichoic acid biosynthesis protein DltD [Streptococcus parauberis]EGE53550.1 DltD C-terminal domain protein [Streptococcus parauberis NCFD 2020]EMF50106.1 Poly(glycerophosphate chain) D-alanine transfer protein [Streptococcus parauberis KRS-02109]KYP20959.1 hypothetical protein AKL13_00581 [Streptococcus parauberis]KYP21343.1 hypothetical protein TN39_00504 [Streptococcus parauberis]KYP22261.1 hypothetical protein AKL14_00258 [Streptococcus parauberis]